MIFQFEVSNTVSHKPMHSSRSCPVWKARSLPTWPIQHEFWIETLGSLRMELHNIMLYVCLCLVGSRPIILPSCPSMALSRHRSRASCGYIVVWRMCLMPCRAYEFCRTKILALKRNAKRPWSNFSRVENRQGPKWTTPTVVSILQHRLCY